MMLQVGPDELRTQGGVEMQHRDLAGPAAAQPPAPAQLQRPDGAVLGELVGEHRTGSVVFVLQRLGEDQPQGRAAARRRPGLAEGREHLVDAPATLGRSHAGQQPRIAQPPPLEARGVPAFLGGQTDAPQQAVGERTRLGDLQRLPELVRGRRSDPRSRPRRCGPSTRSR